jgi:sterol desaturase/sphingolipid hydroxylase (fatty acid hydroxylase superfamily)
MLDVIAFIGWTFLIYLTHRLAHKIPCIRRIHADHHAQVNHDNVGWNWKNLFLYVDTPKSTLDQWLTEVLPTIAFCFLTGAWWIFWFYYIWSAFLQESIEHNSNFDWYPFLTSGRWHLIHHKSPDKNFGVFTPMWDKIFGTFKPL